MRFIGITGGVGAGKSAILSYLAEKPKTNVLLADEIAHELMEPGTDCYKKIVETFAGEDIFVDSAPKTFAGEGEVTDAVCAEQGETPSFHRSKLAQVIFSDDKKREQMNAIVHPAVKDYVQKVYEEEAKEGQLDLLVLEAALLIEEKYDEICDELWYIYTNEPNRRARLKASRGYSDEKIDQIFASQLSEAEFRAATKVTIDNNGDLEETYRQIEAALSNY
ncbi:MAG: dephospho-CoA kinase [Agathobacter sp.]|nr:dephospho-CoA kinase [Agathobacter sp.]